MLRQKNKYPQILLFVALILVIVSAILSLKGNCKGGGILRGVAYFVPLLVFISAYMSLQKRNMFISVIVPIILAFVTYFGLFILIALLSFGNSACLNQNWNVGL